MFRETKKSEFSLLDSRIETTMIIDYRLNPRGLFSSAVRADYSDQEMRDVTDTS